MANSTVMVSLIANVEGFIAGMKSAQAATGQFAAGLEKSAAKRSALSSLGKSAGVMGLVGAAAFVGVVKAAADFDKKMSGVGAVLDKTGMSTKQVATTMDSLRDAAIQAGAHTAFSAGDAADGIAELTKAGVSANDILAGGLQGSLDLAAAGEISVADASKYAATTMSQFGLAGKDIPHIANELAGAANSAQGEVGDFGEAMKYVGPVAHQMGVSLDETIGTMGLLASKGILGSQAGESMRGMLMSLTSPSMTASKEMKKLGINVYDAQGKFVGFNGVAGQLHQKLKGLTNAERDEAFGRIFGNAQVTTARILYEGGAKAIDKWTARILNSNSAHQIAHDKMDNLNGDLENLKGSFETLAISLGESAQGPLRGMTQGLTGIVNAVTDLPPAVKSAATGLAGLTAVAGGGLWAASTAIGAFTKIKGNFATIGLTGEKVSKMMGGMSGKTLMLKGAAVAAGGGLMILSSKLGSAHQSLSTLSAIAGGAAMGSIFGPMGAAIGGGAAAIKNFTGLNDNMNESLAAVQGQLLDNPAAFEANDKAIAGLAPTIDNAADAYTGFQKAVSWVPVVGDTWSGIAGWFGDKEVSKATTASQKVAEAQNNNKEAFSALTNVMAGTTGAAVDYTKNNRQLSITAAGAVPVLDKMHMSLQGLVNAHEAGGARWDKFASHFQAASAAMDSMAGRTDAVGTAITGMNQPLATAAGNAKAIGASMAALFGPTLGISEATDNWAANLQHLHQGLVKGNRDLTGQNDAARQNRGVVRGMVAGIADLSAKQADAGMTAKQMAYHLEDERNALIKSGLAAGLKRKELIPLLRTYGLTPKFITTQFRAAGISQGEHNAKRLGERYKELPKKVQTAIRSHGIPETMGQIHRLAQRYHLTPKQVRTLVRLKDMASGPLRNLLGKVLNYGHQKPVAHLGVDGHKADVAMINADHSLSRFDRMTAFAKLSADSSGAVKEGGKAKGAIDKVPKKHDSKINVTSNADKVAGDSKRSLASVHDVKPKITVSSNAGSAASGAQGSINSVHGKTVTITVNTVHTGSKQADGGYISGPGGPRDDLIPAWLSNGEFVMNAGATSRNLPALVAMNADGYADGGKAKAHAKEHRHAVHDLDKHLKHYDVEGKDDTSETMSNFKSLLALVVKAFGKDSHVVKHLRALGDHLRTVAKLQDKTTKQLEKANATLKETKQESRAYSKSVVDALTHDAFSGDLRSSMMQMRADRNDAKAVRHDLAAAKDKGLDGKLLRELAASGNVALIDQVAHMSRKEIRAYELLLKRRDHATRDVGDRTANSLYGKDIRAQTKTVHHLDHTLNKLERRLNHLERDIERGARHGTHEGTRHRHHRHRAHRRAN